MTDVKTALPFGRRLPPRTVRKLAKACALPLFMGGIWFVAGLVLTVSFIPFGNPLQDYWLSRNGKLTEGTVTELTVNRWSRKNPWSIRYSFEVGARSWNGKSFTTKKDLISHFRKESRIEVEYLPGKPGINRAKGTRASLFSALEFLPALLFVAVGGAILAYGIGRIVRLRNLLVNGQMAVATITEQKLNKLISMGKRKPLDVYYVFQDSRGTEWTGRTRVYFPRRGVQVEPGQELKIVYDYLNPKRSFAYELYDIQFSERL